MTETLELTRRRLNRPLIALLLFALLIRLPWVISRPSDAASIEQLPDQREYLQLSDNVLHGRGLKFFDPRFNDEVVAYRTPGYPLFLAACGASPRIARIAQAFIDTSTVLAIYLLVRRWLSVSQSLVAAAFVAVNPFLIYFSGLLLSETLFTAMLAWSLVLFQRQALLGGLLLALSIMVRPSAAGLPLVLGIASALLNRQSRGAYPRWWPLPPATTLLLLTVAVLMPWAYRNYKLLNRWIWTTTNAGITAYDGLHDDATGASDQRFATRIPGAAQAGEVGRDDYFAREASNWARTHRKRVAELALAKVARTWSPVPLSAEFGRPLYRWIAALYSVPFDLFVILGLCYGRLPRSAKVYLLIPAIYFTAIHAMSVGSLRYRLPAEPPMAILAAVGCLLFVSNKTEYRRAE